MESERVLKTFQLWDALVDKHWSYDMEASLEFWASWLHEAKDAANLFLVPGQGGSKGTHKLLLAGASSFLRSVLISVEQEDVVTLLLPDFKETEVEECFQAMLGGLKGEQEGGLSGALGLWRSEGVEKLSEVLIKPEQSILKVENTEFPLSIWKPKKEKSNEIPQEPNYKCDQCEYKSKRKHLLKNHKYACITKQRMKEVKNKPVVREEMTKAYTLAVESVLKGEGTVSGIARKFGVNNSTLRWWIRSAKQGKQKTWKTKGRVSQIFTVDEEKILQDLILSSEPKLMYHELRGIMQDTLVSAVAGDPSRITGLEHKNQKPTQDYVYRFVNRYDLAKSMKKHHEEESWQIKDPFTFL